QERSSLRVFLSSRGTCSDPLGDVRAGDLHEEVPVVGSRNELVRRGAPAGVVERVVLHEADAVDDALPFGGPLAVDARASSERLLSGRTGREHALGVGRVEIRLLVDRLVTADAVRARGALLVPRELLLTLGAGGAGLRIDHLEVAPVGSDATGDG